MVPIEGIFPPDQIVSAPALSILVDIVIVELEQYRISDPCMLQIDECLYCRLVRNVAAIG